VEAVCNKLEMIVRQAGPNPKCERISNKKDQSTESNAFEISSFKKRLAI